MDPLAGSPPLYLGFRPEDSFELHEAFSGQNTYPFAINPSIKHSYNVLKKKQPLKNKSPFFGMNPSLIDEYLEFSSYFESGNLNKVVKLKEGEYDLYLRPDTNTRGHYQWFYFSIKNPGGARTVKLNILNFSKRESLYTQGLTPCVWDSNRGWHRSDSKVSYTHSKLNKNFSKPRNFCSLSFSHLLEAESTTFFAQSVPYTYSQLLRFLDSLSSPLVQRSTLCKSLSGIDVPLLTISADPRNSKQLIFVTARVHPGETHSSYVVEGFIRSLLAPRNAELLSRCTIKVVPMLNPDGVIAGNTRCNFAGDDLNRKFRMADSRLHPTVHAVKKLMKVYKQKILAYLDFHAHFKKKGSFIYGPHFPLHSKLHSRVRIIPKLMSEITEAFRYHSCKFHNTWAKRNTARLFVSREFKVPFSYTVECSLHGYLTAERTTLAFEEDSLKALGACFPESLQEYIDLAREEARQTRQRRLQRLKKKIVNEVNPTGKRTMADVINSIKADPIEEVESSCSESEDSDNEEQAMIRNNIVNLLEKLAVVSEKSPQKTPAIGERRQRPPLVPKKKIDTPKPVRTASGKPRIGYFRNFRAIRTRDTEPYVKAKLFKPLADSSEIHKRNIGYKFKFRPAFLARPENKNSFFSDSEANVLAKLKEATTNMLVKGRKVKPLELEKRLGES